jgi:hypothetical protein
MKETWLSRLERLEAQAAPPGAGGGVAPWPDPGRAWWAEFWHELQTQPHGAEVLSRLMHCSVEEAAQRLQGPLPEAEEEGG